MLRYGRGLDVPLTDAKKRNCYGAEVAQISTASDVRSLCITTMNSSEQECLWGRKILCRNMNGHMKTMVNRDFPTPIFPTFS